MWKKNGAGHNVYSHANKLQNNELHHDDGEEDGEKKLIQRPSFLEFPFP